MNIQESISTNTHPSRKHSSWLHVAAPACAILYAGCLVLAPILSLVINTFSEGLPAVLAAITEPQLWQALRLTITIALITTAVHAIFGTITAWVLVRDRFPCRRFLSSLIDIPFAVSPVVVGYMLLLLFGRKSILTPLLDWAGIKVAFAVPGMVLATLFVSMPFMIRELIPIFENLDINQEHAAATMGAGKWQIFKSITFPAVRQGMLYGVMLTFARSLGEFGAVLVIGGGIQGRTETLTLFIYRALDERQYTGAYASALMLGLISFALVWITDHMRR